MKVEVMPEKKCCECGASFFTEANVVLCEKCRNTDADDFGYWEDDLL